MNRVTLYGRLGAEPELNNTKTGACVLKFRLATNERQKRGEEWVDHTEWHAVVVWGKRAETLSRMLRKGSAVIVEGALRTSSWEKDGQKRSRTEVSASEVILVGGRDQQAASAASELARAPKNHDPFERDDVPDDLPF